jgi:hypothetical protein
MLLTSRSGPTPDLVFLLAAAFGRSHIRPSCNRQVEPLQAVLVGPNGAVVARRHVVVAGTGHNIPKDRADVVASTILAIAAQAQTSGG